MIIFFLFSFAGGRIYLEAEALPEQPEKKTGVRQRETFPLSLLLFVFSVVVFDPLLRFFVASGLQPPSLGSVAEAKLRPVNCCTQTWKELWPTQTYPMVMRLTPMLATMTLVFSWPWKAKSCAKRAIVVTEWPFLKLLCKRARMILEPYLPSIGKSPRDLRTKEMLVKQKRKCLLYHSVFLPQKRIKKIR